MDQSILILFLVIFLNATFASTSLPVTFYDVNHYEGSPCKLPDGSEGVCRQHCTGRSVNVRHRKICGFQREDVIICCRNEKYMHPTIEKVCENRTKILEAKKLRKQLAREAIRREREEEKRIRFEECVKAAEHMGATEREQRLQYCTRKNQTLRRSHVPSIFAADVNEHPHMAALGRRSSIDHTVQWFCGGILIHEKYVLTAAHCILNMGLPDVVRVGDVSLDAEDKTEYGKEYLIEDIYMHQNYSPPAYYNDIAILRIAANAEHYSIVRPLPACLYTKNDLPVDTLLIMGYGAPAFGRAHNYKLYQGNLTIMSSYACGLFFQSQDELPNGIISSQICAFDPARVMDTCEGDSGGPLQFNINDEFNTPYIAGVTSFGVLCLDGSPGVYTRVYPYLSWIESIIRENEKK